MELLQLKIAGNSLQLWTVTLATALFIWGVLLFAKRLLLQKFGPRLSHERFVGALLHGLLSKLHPLVMLLVALDVSTKALDLPDKANNVMNGLTAVTLLLTVGLWGNVIITFIVGRKLRGKVSGHASAATTLTVIAFAARVVLWSALLLLGLDNFGIDITALVAGLGISGIAAALAAQKILGDIFASLAIVFDKPFVIGDLVSIDGFSGYVESIGMKTTRLRSVTGELLVFSNNDLLNSRIRNFQNVEERRLQFTFGVTYETGYEKLKSIPKLVEEIITAQPAARFDRAHFKDFGDSSLNFEVVFFARENGFKEAMDVQQAVNFELYRRLEQAQIEFAYPTRTVYVRGSENNQHSRRGETQ